MSDNHNPEPDGIEALLPWYAKGTLSAGDTRRVEAHLTAHPELRAALALIAEEMDEAVAANERLGVPSAAARGRLMDAIAAEGAEGAGGGASLWQRAKSAWAALLPEGASPALAFGGAMAALVIAVQAVALVGLLVGGEPSPGGGTTRLAGGAEASANSGTVLLVHFTGDATAAGITGLLKPLGASVVDGPKPGNAYKIRVSPDVLPPEARAAIIEKLRARSDIVSFVAPAG